MMIVMEGDTGIAQCACGNCGKVFRFVASRVTTANKHPICAACIKWANPKRKALGLEPMSFDRTAYYGLPENTFNPTVNNDF